MESERGAPYDRERSPRQPQRPRHEQLVKALQHRIHWHLRRLHNLFSNEPHLFLLRVQKLLSIEISDDGSHNYADADWKCRIDWRVAISGLLPCLLPSLHGTLQLISVDRIAALIPDV